MTTRKALIIGPFSRGINTYDDPTAIHDQECAEALNFDPGLDGSLKSRPPFSDTGSPLPISGTEAPRLVGYFYDVNGVPYLFATDGTGSTWYYVNGAWTLVTNTFAATDAMQFDGKMWLVSPVGEDSPGGYWSPDDGFVADSDMPRGTSITSYKSRLWIAEGLGGVNPTRIRYSKVLGQPNFWQNAGFVDVGSGDGQNIVKIVAYFDSVLVFRTKSIWSFQYGVDPAQAIQSVVVPGIGLQSKHSLVSHENYIYFMYDEKAYSFINNRAQQLNIKVPFETRSPGSTKSPYTVSLFNNRILYSFYENIYVYSLRTNTWTTWKSEEWGPIGQLLMPIVDDDTDVAYALPSGITQPRAQADKNLIWNPSAAVNTTFIGTSTGAGTLARSTAIAGSDHCATWKNTSTTGKTQLRFYNMPVTPGETLVVSGKIRALQAGSYFGYTYVDFIDSSGVPGQGNGTIIGTTINEVELVPIAGNTWQRVSQEFTVPEGATYVRALLGFNDPGTVGRNFAVDDVKIGKDDDYFDGSTSDGATYSYEWLGTANGSESYRYLNGAMPLLRIEDKLTNDRENMLCALTTKNYNFDVPGSFKVLFYWGVDAIFKTNIQGQVVPGVYSQSTTWRQILNAAKSWGELLGGTWQHPYLSDPSVVSEVQTMAGPVRKFVKFFKKLRFRQVYFRVTFRTDGSGATAPVQVFTLSAYMAEKQTVSKTVT